jgi:hypothetical protein
MPNVLSRAVTILWIVCLTACSSKASTPSPTPTYEISKQCMYTYEAQAWLDEDQDGNWDAGEVPLPGVTFAVKGARSSVSNAQGRAILQVDWGGASCTQAEQEANFVIAVVDMPSGYRLTTPDQQPAPPRLAHFGFAPDIPAALP